MGNYLEYCVLKNGLPVDFYFVQQTSINRPNRLLELKHFIGSTTTRSRSLSYREANNIGLY